MIYKITDAFNRYNKIKAQSMVAAVIKLIDSDLRANGCCPAEFDVEAVNDLASCSSTNQAYSKRA